ncbi:MAG: hypothetical protein JXB40_03220 [Candidatus Omnitrophica bacterium]|nr:hypothetical protein [Candidatus Omnitrophota bacterium]
MVRALMAVMIALFCSVIGISSCPAEDYDSTAQEEAAVSSSLSSTIIGEESEGLQNMEEMETSMEGNSAPRTPIDED